MLERVRKQVKQGEIITDEMDNDSENMDLAGRKLKRRKLKKKKPKKKKAPKEPQIDDRDLKMAQAYGGMTQAQVDKLIQEKRRKELALAS